MRTILLAAVATAVASCGAASQAELIAWDSFAVSEGGSDYNIGAVQYQNPNIGLGGFVGAWNGGTRHPAAIQGGLTHKLTPGAQLDGMLVPYTSDVGWANRRLSREIDYTPVTGEYYLSVLLQKNHQEDGDIAGGLAPLESSSWSYSTLQGTYVGLYQGAIVFGTTSSIETLVPSDDVRIGETYFALMQFDYDTGFFKPDTVTATIYDSSATEVTSRPFQGLDLDGDIGRMGYIVSDLVPTVAMDEFRFGMQLSDVMVPQGLAGDYNEDGIVNAADYTVWRDNLGDADETAIHFNGDGGDIGASDHGHWIAHYGDASPTPTASPAEAAPEPTSLWLLVLATGAAVRRRRCRKRQ